MNKKLSFGRRAYIYGMKALMYASTAAMGALVLFLIGYVLYRGIPNITWKFLTTAPSILNDTIGIWPDILNSIYVVIATIIIVLPLGVCAAVYLSEYASNKKLVRVIEYAAETLSGIPSIIYGLVGMLFFCEFLKMQTSLMAGALTLVIMNLPTVMRTTQESLKTVPRSYREGAFGLGAGKWRVIRTVVLPGCTGGGDDLSDAVEIPPETTPAASSGGDMQNDNAAQNGGSSGNTAEYGLEIKGISKYAGLFVEDGTDETVSDVCAVTVRNNAEKTVQYAHLTVTIGETAYEFDVTTLPPDAEVQLLELTRQPMPESTDGYTALVTMYAAFDAEPGMNADALEITTQDTAITVKNISGKDMGQVYVYYKVAYGELYLGGITYRVGVNGLAAGQSTTCYAGHYSTEYSKLMFATYEH